MGLSFKHIDGGQSGASPREGAVLVMGGSGQHHHGGVRYDYK